MIVIDAWEFTRMNNLIRPNNYSEADSGIYYKNTFVFGLINSS